MGAKPGRPAPFFSSRLRSIPIKPDGARRWRRGNTGRAARSARGMGIETILLVLGGVIVLAIAVAAMKRNRR
jgi:hypothetical protein